MSIKATTLQDEVHDILRNATVNGDRLTLNGQLDHKQYDAVMKAIEAIGGKWNRSQKCHIFDRPVQPLLDAMFDSGKVPAKNPFAYFATPVDVIDQMIELLDIDSERDELYRILEPSAGEGAIVRRVKDAYPINVTVDAYEVDTVRHGKAHAAGAYMLGYDFMAAHPEPVYDIVLMNPPFAIEGNPLAYVDHIRHAARFLKPGGELVAIAPNGFLTRTDKKCRQFGELLDSFRFFTQYKIADNAFKESGTGVNTVMIHIRQ